MSQRTDRFGNVIDPVAGYAPGLILSDSLAHIRRRRHALTVLSSTLSARGWDGIYNFTGHSRQYVLAEAGLSPSDAEEWVGQSVFERELRTRALTHMGGDDTMSTGTFNRSSACIVATALALAQPGEVIASIAPGRRSHTSIHQAAQLCGARLIEFDPDDPHDWVEWQDCPLVMITRVTSEIDVIPETRVASIVSKAKKAGKLTFIDDAYGAQLAPVVLGQRRALAMGANLAVTSCDKAGLAGPRGGLLVGCADLVDRIVAKASEIGLEARAPVALGILAALRCFSEEELKADCAVAQSLYASLAERLGEEYLISTVMGPTIPEEQAVLLVLERARVGETKLAPCEVTCIIASHLMRKHGFLTSNVAERPGARVSLRLRTVAKEIKRFGGVDAVADAVVEAVDQTAAQLQDLASARELIFGT